LGAAEGAVARAVLREMEEQAVGEEQGGRRELLASAFARLQAVRGAAPQSRAVVVCSWLGPLRRA
jgi:hypothetical protein